MTDKYLLSLWSKAVLASKGSFCYNPECGNPAHSCHHIIRVKHRMTRYDVRNGIPLCAECHRKAQRSIGWDIDLIPQGDKEWLREMANVNVKDYLVARGITRNELDKRDADVLKSITEAE